MPLHANVPLHVVSPPTFHASSPTMLSCDPTDKIDRGSNRRIHMISIFCRSGSRWRWRCDHCLCRGDRRRIARTAETGSWSVRALNKRARGNGRGSIGHTVSGVAGTHTFSDIRRTSFAIRTVSASSSRDLTPERRNPGRSSRTSRATLKLF